MGESIVVVEGLSKSFGKAHGPDARWAVRDVSFQVARGGALAVVGESGSGKTTVARCLVGLETPTEGEIRICGRSRTGVRPSRRERRLLASQIQLVFQDPRLSLDPRQRIGSSLREALGARGVTPGRTDVLALLDRVGLSAAVADAFPSTLSGGQRQRVAIARALAFSPEVVVFDESVAALDVSVQAQILNLIADLRESEGLTIIVISHDLAVVRQITEDVVVMRRGEIVERGTTASVLDGPQAAYTRLLIDSVPGPGWNPATALLGTGTDRDPTPPA